MLLIWEEYAFICGITVRLHVVLQKSFRMLKNMDKKQDKNKSKNRKTGYDTMTDMIEFETAKYVQ
jgi:hypothetical protein